jgi:putative membrane protein (TIGR04086 family)
MKLLFFKRIFLGVITGAATLLLMLLLSAAFLSSRDDPLRNLSIFAEISLILGAFVCGKISTLGLESRAVQGASAALAFTLAVLLPSLIASSFGAGSYISMILTPISAFTGAMIGRKKNDHRPAVAKRKNVMKRYAH